MDPKPPGRIASAVRPGDAPRPVNAVDRATTLTGPSQPVDCTGIPNPLNMRDMPPPRRPRKVPIYFRVSPEAAARIKQFLADFAGKPLYLKPGEWAEEVLLRAVEATEVSAAPPPAPAGVRRIPDNHSAPRR